MKIIGRAVYIFVCALPPAVFCFLQGELMLAIAAAIILHECGHIFAVRFFGGRLCGFRPAPFGLCIEYDANSLSLFGEAVVVSFGCVVNLLLAIASFAVYRVFGIDAVDFGIANAALFLINIIPVKQLDGGNLLYIVCEFLFGNTVAFAVLAAFTGVFGFAIFIFASYSLLTSVGGIYPLLFSVYLFVCNAKMLEKAVFGEKTSI